MSRLHEALRKAELENQQSVLDAHAPSAAKLPDNGAPKGFALDAVRSVAAHISPQAHLVALTNPLSLGAEKFRVLATRLVNLRQNQQLKSLQITSATQEDGKTLTSANLAATLATRCSSNVLLIEGDLHKPNLAGLFGLNEPPGLSHWWSDSEARILNFVQHLNEISLYLLTAGPAPEQPSDILRSPRFAKTFRELTHWFDWVIVDSTPLLPMVDANLWSQLVDATLLVVREQSTPIEALKKGLASLDNPKLIGVVLNDASQPDQASQYEKYYRTQSVKPEPETKRRTEEVV